MDARSLCLGCRAAVVYLLLFMVSCSEPVEYLGQPLPLPTNGFAPESRIAFVGNSITQGGYFHRNLSLYYLLRYPHLHWQFSNRGIAADVAANVLHRLQPDILHWQPDYVLLKLGMNDVGISHYPLQQQWVHKQRQQKAFSTFQTDYRKLVKQLAFCPIQAHPS